MKTLIAVALLVLVAGCGGTTDKPKSEAKPAPSSSAPTDPDADWKAALEEIRGEPMSPAKWAQYSESIRTNTCTNDDFVTLVAIGYDIPGTNPKIDRLAVKYACPSRLTEWDQAVSTEAGYIARGKLLCGPTKKVAERLAIAAKLSEPDPLTDDEILSAVCD